VQAYIQQYLTPLTPLVKGGTGEEDSLTHERTEEEISHRISPPFLRGVGGDLKELEDRLIQQLTAQSENNFMYLSQILPAIAQGLYSEPFQIDRLPPGLEAYYQSHLQRMTGENLPSVELGVLRCLATSQPPVNPLLKHQEISAEFIAETIDEDEYEVETVLENWIEFLQQQQIEGQTYYRLYHSSFRNWLCQQFHLNQIF
jgi:hypothetical protein